MANSMGSYKMDRGVGCNGGALGFVKCVEWGDVSMSSPCLQFWRRERLDRRSRREERVRFLKLVSSQIMLRGGHR
mgnify:CR=1 FL=1